MPIPDNQKFTVEIALIGSIPTGGSNIVPTVNVFHFSRTTTVNPFNKVNIAGAFDTTVGAAIANALNAVWAASKETVRAIDDADDLPTDVASTLAGAVAGDRMTTINAAYLRIRTGLRGKHYRGSKHLGPLSESDTTTPNEDIFNAGAISNFGSVSTAIMAGFTDADGNVWVPVVLSRSISQLRVNPTTVIINPMASCTLNKRVGRLRRREVKSVY